MDRGFGTPRRGYLFSRGNGYRGSIVEDRAKRVEMLEEVVRRLESVGHIPPSELGFDDARVDGYVATALSAARTALSIATKQDAPGTEQAQTQR